MARCESGATSWRLANAAAAWVAFDGSLAGAQQEPGVSPLFMLGIEFGRYNFRLGLTRSDHQLLQLIAQHLRLLSEFFSRGQVDHLVRVTALVVEKIFVVPGAG